MKKRRILFVEDGAIFREPIKLALEQEGYKVDTATNGFEALDKLKTVVTPFDLFLIDVAMPEMDGFTFLRKVRETPAWAEVPVIMLTAVAEREFVLKARELDVKEYLIKAQFSLNELITSLQRHLA